MKVNSFLVLEDGSSFKGSGWGAEIPLVSELQKGKIGTCPAGEVVFNTSMTGYQEIVTDPSYTGQIVLMTYPHIGNYGTDDNWSQSSPHNSGHPNSGKQAAALVVRSLYNGPVTEGRLFFNDFLKREGISCISDVDTRALTLSLRNEGSRNGVIVRSNNKNLSEAELKTVLEYLNTVPSMEGRDLISDIGTEKIQTLESDTSKNLSHFAIIDCGIKKGIVQELQSQNVKVTLFPSSSDFKQILNSGVNAVLFSNGPGDPAVLEKQIILCKELVGKIPVFGICLGHQIMAHALGGKTLKMKFGHHGGNHPVRDEKTGKVFVTAQNHGFMVDENSLPENVSIRFRNANDLSVEGLFSREKQIFTAQFHPEAEPGPDDSTWIFKEFVDLVKEWEGK
ncbi:MAG: glutamine-hydrolyzing carbamoyl-phosphate synthase small subunit [Spirochaetaceae bacterium]|jgi:carbamoyl-phosphate synthase small subunit|nr:glutamine-hydrolyzing carbamoyl-phosphate synthase small subunit [Spirochaetaceae bacterium]